MISAEIDPLALNSKVDISRPMASNNGSENGPQNYNLHANFVDTGNTNPKVPSIKHDSNSDVNTNIIIYHNTHLNTHH